VTGVGASDLFDPRSRIETGETLWGRCKDGPASANDWENCKFFVGLAHEFTSIASPLIVGPQEERICFPEPFDGEAQARVFTDYLRDHPEERQQRAIELYHRAMRAAYPCP
jgi:hypothetical protein